MGAFLIKVAFERHNKLLLMVGMVASLYGLWLLYASGLINLMLSVVLYAPGILVFGMRELSNPNKLHLIWLKRLSLWLLSRGQCPQPTIYSSFNYNHYTEKALVFSVVISSILLPSLVLAALFKSFVSESYII